MKDVDKSASMHMYNLHERIRKGKARCPPKILDRIEEAFSGGEMETVINLCSHGGWGRMAGVADNPTNAEIKQVMEAQYDCFKDHGEDDKSEMEVNEKLQKMLKNRTL